MLTSSFDYARVAHDVRIVGVAFLLTCCLAGQGQAATEETTSGTLRGVVFTDSFGTKPLPQALIRIRDLSGAANADLRELTTNRDGAFSLTLKPGLYEVQLGVANTFHVVGQAPVVSGESTEVLLTHFSDGREPQFNVEAPSQTLIQEQKPSPQRVDGKLLGKIVHAETAAPVADARIFVRQVPSEARTNAQGEFILALPRGIRCDLSIVHPKFATLSHQITIARSQDTTQATLQLTPAGLLLDDYTVTAPKVVGSSLEILNEQRNSGTVADIIGAEQMAKAGDSDAASALRRVTGVTLVGGKFVYVRGLGKRYSNTLFNGSSLPSPEPELRVVPFDLFPVSILDSVVIQKTYSPDLPADFGGGTIKLRTRNYPRVFKANIGFSGGILVGTTFNKGIGYEGGPTDFLGFGSGFRARPNSVAEASASSRIAPQTRFDNIGLTKGKLQQLGRDMANRWNLTESRTTPNLGLTASIGDSYALWGGRTGFLLGAIYNNAWDTQPDKEVNIFTTSTAFDPGGGLADAGHRYIEQRLTNNITLAGILSAGWEKGQAHSIKLTSVVMRVSQNETREYGGFNRDLGSDLRVTRLTWIERMLFSQGIAGEHRLDALHRLKLNWRYTFSLAKRLEPDRREYRYDLKLQTGLYLLSDRPEGNQRFFSNLQDTNHDAGLDAALPFTQWSGLEVTLKAGGMIARKTRAVDVRRYTFRAIGPRARDADLIRRSPEEIFQPENIAPDAFELTEVTLDADNYTGVHTIAGGYAMVDLPLGWDLRLVAGVRIEHSAQNISTFKPFSPEVIPVEGNLNTTDLLPSAVLSWSFHNKMALRLGVSQTVNRPTLRELSPAVTVETTGGRLFFGNPELKRALIRHVDLRWEWYPGRNQLVAISGFFKHFQDPIETLVIRSAQFSITPGNSDGATNFGVELEVRKNFAFLHHALRDLSIAGNASLIRSRVTLPTGATFVFTSQARALQGQSPFVINLQLSYDNADIGTRVAFLYNVFGRRIAQAGALGSPDVFEEPFHQLDLVARQRLGAGFSATFKAQNLINPTARMTQGAFITERFRKGRVFSLGLAKSF